MSGQAGVEDLTDGRVADQHVGDPLGVLAMPVHPDRQGLGAP